MAALAVAIVLATGCSDDDDASRGTTGAPTTGAPSTSTTGATSTVPAVTSSVATTRPGSTATTSPTPTTAPTNAGPAVAEAGGWRLVISHPTARATVPPAAVLCYEATGSSREPDLVLEVTAVPPGTTARVPVPVGRGTARVDLSAAGVGARDLRIQLVPNGLRIDGLSVTIPVTIAAGAPAGTC